MDAGLLVLVMDHFVIDSLVAQSNALFSLRPAGFVSLLIAFLRFGLFKCVLLDSDFLSEAMFPVFESPRYMSG